MRFKKFNISYRGQTAILKSAVVEADSILSALSNFEDNVNVIGIVEVEPESTLEPVTMLADMKSKTLLRNGKKENIIEVSDTHVTTESGMFSLNNIKCVT